MRTQKLLAACFLILSIFWSGVIWNFSIRDSVESTSESDSVTEAIENFIGSIAGRDIEISTAVIRKLAHFSEFAVLGILTFLTVSSFGVNKMRKIFLICSVWTFLTAAADETIQLFSPGRSASVFDVLLDFSGAVLALILCSCLSGMFKPERRNVN